LDDDQHRHVRLSDARQDPELERTAALRPEYIDGATGNAPRDDLLAR
jgi:hypothetical protein